MATYYIDPIAGDDSRTLLQAENQGTPWKHLPGTRLNTADTLLNSNVVAGGSTLEIKAGSVFDSTYNSGRCDIRNYIGAGTAQAPTIIKISTTWGSGNVVFDGTDMEYHQDAWPDSWGLLHNNGVDYVHVLGNSTDQFEFNNCQWTNGYGIHFYGNVSTLNGCRLDYVTADGNTHGIGMGFSDDFEMYNCVATNNGVSGIAIGSHDDEICVNGDLYDCRADDNGNGTTGQGTAVGIHVVGCTGITMHRCTADGNRRDGFDNGTASNAADNEVTFIDCVASNNLEDGFAGNGSTTGSGNTAVYRLVNCIAFNNATAPQTVAGGFCCYEGGDMSLYHCLAAYNGNNFACWAITGYTSSIYARNCISWKPADDAIDSYTGAGVGSLSFDFDYCMFVPATADTEGLYVNTGTNYNYTETPAGAYMTWGANNQKGIAVDPDFTAVHATIYASNDFHPASNTGDSIGAGVLVSNPSQALTDLDAVSRGNPPDLGVFEYVDSGTLTTLTCGGTPFNNFYVLGSTMTPVITEAQSPSPSFGVIDMDDVNLGAYEGARGPNVDTTRQALVKLSKRVLWVLLGDRANYTSNSAAKTEVARMTLPGGTMGPNGILFIHTLTKNTDAANTAAKVFVDMDSQPIVSVAHVSGQLSSLVGRSIANLGDEAVQFAQANGYDGWGLGTGSQNLTMDTSQDIDLVFSVQSNGTDDVTLAAAWIELIRY